MKRPPQKKGAEQMRVIKLLQQGGSENIDIPNTLEALQKEVGGYIETLTLAPGVVMIVD